MKPFPTLLGHEEREVVALGAKVRHIQIGDRHHPNLGLPRKWIYKDLWGMAEYGLVADYQTMKEDGYDGPPPFSGKYARAKSVFLYRYSMLLSLSESLSAAKNLGSGLGQGPGIRRRTHGPCSDLNMHGFLG